MYVALQGKFKTEEIRKNFAMYKTMTVSVLLQ
jgi:hypothetical protein